MIYFMQPVRGGPVKIGYTNNLETRHKSLEKHYGLELAILATMEGDLATESEVHKKFDHLRLKGFTRGSRHVEQFRPTQELYEFIGKPFDPHFNSEVDRPIFPAAEADRDDRTARIDSTVLGWADMVAKAKGITLAEYLTETLSAPVARDFARVMEDMKSMKGGDR